MYNIPMATNIATAEALVLAWTEEIWTGVNLQVKSEAGVKKYKKEPELEKAQLQELLWQFCCFWH